MSPISADLALYNSRDRRGGGLLWLVPYDSTKDPYQPHASVAVKTTNGGTTLTAYRAPTSDTNTPSSFGSSGTLDVDIFAEDGAAESKTYSALAANIFTIAALSSTLRNTHRTVKKNNASDYTLTDWKNCGFLAGTKFRDKTASENEYDERNVKVASFDGIRDTGLVTGFMQSGKQEIDFLTKEARGNFYAAKYVVNVGADGNQIFVIRKCKIVADLEFDYSKDTSRVLPVTLEILTDGSNEPYVVYEG